MEFSEDIRWKQRFSNYEKALTKLKQAIDNYETFNAKEQIYNRSVFEQLKEGLIQRFEYVYELAWNVMKDYVFYMGEEEPKSPRDAMKKAFKIGLIHNYEIWTDIIKSRQQTSHTYDEEKANKVFIKITEQYITEFLMFYNVMQNKLIEDKMNIGFTDLQLEKIINIFSQHQEIESAVLFGSRAKGTYRYNSDIDIALKGNVSLTIMNKISDDLDELNIPNEFDLIIFNTIDNPDLINHIERVGITIYKAKDK